nr:DUF1919 domain-containing protein [Methylobacterium mesophilicum]
MRYNTPFVGLFLYADDYIKLLTDFRANMSSELRFVTRSRNGQEPGWPIGVIGDDIEINFMHYGSVEEAREKWAYRTDRLPKEDDNLLFKICDRDGFSGIHADAFDQLPFKNKICFYNRHRTNLPAMRVSHPVDYPGEECPDGVMLWKITRLDHELRIIDWLKSDCDSHLRGD